MAKKGIQETETGGTISLTNVDKCYRSR